IWREVKGLPRMHTAQHYILRQRWTSEGKLRIDGREGDALTFARNQAREREPHDDAAVGVGVKAKRREGDSRLDEPTLIRDRRTRAPEAVPVVVEHIPVV